MCSSALMLVAWRHRFAAFFIPPFLMRFVGRFLQDHLVLDPIDPARRNAVMRSIRVGIAFGQDDPITGNLIDLSAMFAVAADDVHMRSEEHTSELQSIMRISYAVFCLNKKHKSHITQNSHNKKRTGHN